MSSIECEHDIFITKVQKTNRKNTHKMFPLQCESKNTPYGFLKIFPKRLGIF